MRKDHYMQKMESVVGAARISTPRYKMCCTHWFGKASFRTRWVALQFISKISCSEVVAFLQHWSLAEYEYGSR